MTLFNLCNNYIKLKELIDVVIYGITHKSNKTNNITTPDTVYATKKYLD